MPEYTADFDDDLGDAEAIQALSNAENNHDVKPHIKVLYYIDSIPGYSSRYPTISILYWFTILIQY